LLVLRDGSQAIDTAVRRDVLLAFHRLKVPAMLNITFLSTNLIEKVLRNWREATGDGQREVLERKRRHGAELDGIRLVVGGSGVSQDPPRGGFAPAGDRAGAGQLEACIPITLLCYLGWIFIGP